MNRPRLHQPAKVLTVKATWQLLRVTWQLLRVTCVLWNRVLGHVSAETSIILGEHYATPGRVGSRLPGSPSNLSAPSYGYAPAYAPAMRVAPTAGSSGPPPPGSWECVACQNVNFPTRDKCNAKNCGQPRHLVDGGAPSYSPPPPPRNSSAPEGSWTCPGCENLNYPTRTVCNKRGCGLAKPA